MSPTLESPVLEKLREEILALPSEQRELLIAAVSEDTDGSFSLHPDWEEEIGNRVEELRSNRVQGISAEDVFREIDELVDHA